MTISCPSPQMPRPGAVLLTLTLMVAMATARTRTYRSKILRKEAKKYCDDDLVNARQEACQMVKYDPWWEPSPYNTVLSRGQQVRSYF